MAGCYRVERMSNYNSNNFNFNNTGLATLASFDFNGGVRFSLEPYFNPTLVLNAISCDNKPSVKADLVSMALFGKSNAEITSVIDVSGERLLRIAANIEVLNVSLGRIDTVNNLQYDEMHPITANVSSFNSSLTYIDSGNTINTGDSLVNIDIPVTLQYGCLPNKDRNLNHGWYKVDLYASKGVRPIVTPYYPTMIFNHTGIPNKYSFNLYNVNWDTVRTRMSPVDSSYKSSLNYKFNKLNICTSLRYGRGTFTVASPVLIPDNVDNSGTEPPADVIVHPEYEVFRIVNIVNIFDANDTVIPFTDFTIKRDIESFAWEASFNISALSYDLIRPVGNNFKTIRVVINNIELQLVVTKASRTIEHGKRRHSIRAFSGAVMFNSPYRVAGAYNQSQALTSSQIATALMAGSGIGIDWQTTVWTLPAGLFSYESDTSIGALKRLANVVGAVLNPSLDGKTITVKPYYPVSPWQWGSATVNHTISENQFLSMGDEPVPRTNPNYVAVFGKTDSSTAVEVVRAGTAGDIKLKDVTADLLTSDDSAKERGRIELAKNSFIEFKPMVTYVDTAKGIFYPQDLVEFTELDGVTKWRGMVVSLSITCKEQGTALMQHLTVAKYYES